MFHFRIPMKLATGALVTAIGLAGTPADAGLMLNSLTFNALTLNALTVNAITHNALTAKGSAIDELNGVGVEAATAPDEVAFDPQPIPPGL
jgi:hypothetical protein